MAVTYGDAMLIALTAAIALIAGLAVSTVLYRMGKKNNAGYDWWILWLSVSIIVFVAETLFSAFIRL
ncbi:MAG: hypothetical protein LBQ36_08405 [Synergistaceae bacterium]|jgi:hypothetical protein|nr:hypothetical protein [Synergistaceae bacterium]